MEKSPSSTRPTATRNHSSRSLSTSDTFAAATPTRPSPHRAQSVPLRMTLIPATDPPPPYTAQPNWKHRAPRRPDPAYWWGVAPKESSFTHKREIWEMPPDHPVHRLSHADIEKMRAKGINPILRAEMDGALCRGEPDQGVGRKFRRSVKAWYLGL